jgi:hypothetical protein
MGAMPILPKNTCPLWKAAAGLMIAGWVAAAIAWLLAFVDIESIMLSGPVLMLLAMAGAVVAGRARSGALFVTAVVQWGMPVAIFILIVGMNWGPNAARAPVLTIGAIYLATLAPFVAWAFYRGDAARTPWTCAHCGYALIGLTKPRCPECGSGFNAAEVEQAIAMAGLQVPARAPQAHSHGTPD